VPVVGEVNHGQTIAALRQTVHAFQVSR